MWVVIRDGEKTSLKMSFILELLDSNTDRKILCIYRKETSKFIEERYGNKINLTTTISANFAGLLLMIFRSPQDIHDALLEQVFKRKRKHVLNGAGYLSVLSQALYYYFATRTRTRRIIPLLRGLKSRPVFLIDEFWSINTVNQETLKRLGKIIYVSQDVAYNRYGFGDHLVTKKLMYTLERKAITIADLVIACSERDRLKYIEMGAQKAIFYPNIYPLENFEPLFKNESPTISIISREHWGSKVERSLEEIFNALSLVGKKITVCVFGKAPKSVAKNINLQHYDFVPDKLQYLSILSKSWIGINIGFHMSGTNERKYDYAQAGLVVFSDGLGARGDLLPHEYTYVDSHDLAAKLEQLLQFGKDKISVMGTQNRKQVLLLVKEQRGVLIAAINNLVFLNR